MIRASKALQQAQVKTYYETEYSKGDYYTKDARTIPGQWSGQGAKELGLEGEVEKETFEAVLEGKKGPAGDLLIPGEVGTDKHRAAWDFTCSPEKTISIMALVGGDQGIIDDVRAANARAMAELERFAMAKDRWRNLETTGNLVIAGFQHDTSRRLDPQLHIHNVIMNMTRRGDGKFVALETREMYAAQAFVKSVFHADLAQRLKARGYEIEVRGNGTVAIKDVPQGLVDTFSKRRRKDIEPYLAAHGLSGAKAAEEAAVRTRKAKDHDIQWGELRDYWQSIARGHGVDLEAIRAKAERHRTQAMDLAERVDRYVQAKDSLAFAIEHVGERKAAFQGRDLLGAALRHGMGSIVLEDVQAVLRKGKGLVRVEDPACPSHRYTTQEAVDLEKKNILAMRAGKGAGQAILGQDRFEPSRPLTDGQRQVAEHILTSRDQVLAVEGKAGAGKTYTLQTVVAEAGARGWQVRGFAPDTSAVRTLAEETGIEARTIAALERERPSGRPAAGKPQLWLVDEAGKMSSLHAEIILEKARVAGAKVVLVGDRLQHASVEAGKPFAYLQEAGLRAERLDEIRRQKDEHLRSAVVEASEGRSRVAVASLEAQGKVIECPDQAARHREVVQDYLATPKGQTCLVIAPSNPERWDLNHRIREALIQDGRVAKDSFQASIQVSRGLSAAEKKDVRSYQVGDFLTFQQGSKAYGIPNRSEAVVKAVDADKKTLRLGLPNGRQVEFKPHRFGAVEVSRVETRRFAVGDRIQYREAQKPDGLRIQGQGFRIANGDTGFIRELDRDTGQAQVELEGSRRTVQLDFGRIQPVDLAYALTSHASQGRTVDRSLVVVDTEHSRELVNRQQFYVSISRARFEARVYTSSKSDLAAAVSRDAGKSSALDLVKRSNPKEERNVQLEVGPDPRRHDRKVPRWLAGPIVGPSRKIHAYDVTRGSAVSLDGGPPGRARSDRESQATIALRRGPADRAAERPGLRHPSQPGPHARGRERVEGLDRAEHNPSGRAFPGQAPAGRTSPEPQAGLDRREGRGQRPDRIRAPEPRIGEPGPAGRLGGGQWDRERVPGPGPAGPTGAGTIPPGGGGPGSKDTGAAHPALQTGREAARLDRRVLGGADGGRRPDPGPEMNPGDDQAVAQIRTGRAMLVDHGHRHGGLLGAWESRERELLAMTGREDSGLPREVAAAAEDALRIGQALEREAAAEKIRVPRALQALEPDIQKGSARIRACGLEDPFREDALKAIPPVHLRSALEEVRKEGLLAEGPVWAIRLDQVPALAEGLQKSFHRQLELDRDMPGLPGGLGRGA